MSTTVVVLLILAGLSESAGRLLPLIARMPKLSLRLVAGLMICGTVVEGTLFGLWPFAAWIVAVLVQPIVTADAAALPWTTSVEWTPSLAAPLLLAAILAFPLLGPFLHVLLVAGVGARLAGPLSAASGLDWWTAAGCIAIAGVALAGTVEAIRRLIGMIVAGRPAPEVIV
jgi:hypothetical protein